MHIRRTILAATFSAAGVIGGLAAVAPAHAAGPSLCVTAHVDINGNVKDVNQCTSDLPAPPPAPTPPAPTPPPLPLPALPLP